MSSSAVGVGAAHGDGDHLGARRLDRGAQRRVRRELARPEEQPRAERAAGNHKCVVRHCDGRNLLACLPRVLIGLALPCGVVIVLAFVIQVLLASR